MLDLDKRFVIRIGKKLLVVSLFLQRNAIDYLFVLFRVELFRKAGFWLYPFVLQIEKLSLGIGVLYYTPVPALTKDVPFEE